MSTQETTPVVVCIPGIKGRESSRVDIGIREHGRYGYFERHDGNYTGGLWFEPIGRGRFELTDYDGVYTLSRRICDVLVAMGIEVAPEFYPDGNPTTIGA